MSYKFRLQHTSEEYDIASSLISKIKELEEILYIEDDFEERFNLKSQIDRLEDRVRQYIDY